jgi:NAD-dependent SIR2 family protein deacetylase
VNAITRTEALRLAADYTAIERAVALIARADALVIAAGAGMGVDSGVADFRGNAGFWRAYPPLGAAGFTFADIATPGAFDRDARRAWGFQGHRLALYRHTTPHAGYRLLQRWSEAMEHRGFVFTSNVDGHFQRAGFDPLRIEECHGSIHYLQCQARCSNMTWMASALMPTIDETRCEWTGSLPACPHCGRLARPNIQMFDDSDWIGDRHDLQALRRYRWLDQVQRPVVIEIGAGLNVRSVRDFAQRVVRERSGSLIRINPHEAQMGNLPGIGIAGGALAALTAIDDVLTGNSPFLR